MNEKGRTKMICCRLTVAEYEKLQQLFENSSFSNQEKKKYSDFCDSSYCMKIIQPKLIYCTLM